MVQRAQKSDGGTSYIVKPHEITIRPPGNLYEAFKAVAEASYISVSALIYQLMAAHVKQHKLEETQQLALYQRVEPEVKPNPDRDHWVNVAAKELNICMDDNDMALLEEAAKGFGMPLEQYLRHLCSCAITERKHWGYTREYKEQCIGADARGNPVPNPAKLQN